MPVRIDSLETDIEMQSEAPPQAGGSPDAASAWQALERLRQLLDRQRRDDARTRAWDHDD